MDISEGYALADCPGATRYDTLPAVKIARLAVDARQQKKGIGQALIDAAMICSLNEIAPVIGCRFLITDAKKESVSFIKSKALLCWLTVI